MSYFPLFVNLKDQCCMVVGDGQVARRKADALRRYEAKVVMYEEGQWKMEDLSQAFLVVAATDDRRVNHQIASYCKAHGIGVNVADSKEDSTFLFPSLVQRGPISIGISTGGNSPLMSAQIRRVIEEAVPEEEGDIVEFMGEVRSWVKKLPIEQQKRKEIFQIIYTKAKEKNRKLKVEEMKEAAEELLGEEYDNIDKE
ncbi:MAG: bifunctional precorrin-2 dehydrogenase/sirohydrochlorin ferrochelatase [Anaerostipes sp.]|nr:bifunctional precorrin-2 dehydrogenase/sirohydrochlorin ferrochelatase [Anaerostipes sp.]